MDRLKKELRMGPTPEAGLRVRGGARDTGTKWPRMLESPKQYKSV